MKVIIEEKPAFKMFGIERIINSTKGQNFIDIPKFWQACFADGSVEKLEKSSGINITSGYEGLLPVNSVMSYKDTGKDSFPYMIGCLVLESSDPRGYEIIEIPALKWGVFRSENFKEEDTTEVVQGLWRKIFSDWFPSVAYEIQTGAQLEMYYKDKDKMEYCEVWIPIK